MCNFASDYASPNRQRPAMANDYEGEVGQTNIDGIQRPIKPFVGQAEGKGRFRTLLSVSSNFANLNPYTEVMQR